MVRVELDCALVAVEGVSKVEGGGKPDARAMDGGGFTKQNIDDGFGLWARQASSYDVRWKGVCRAIVCSRV